jgi:hypothetical protein
VAVWSHTLTVTGQILVNQVLAFKPISRAIGGTARHIIIAVSAEWQCPHTSFSEERR